jgi:chromosome segregation ATPase
METNENATVETNEKREDDGKTEKSVTPMEYVNMRYADFVKEYSGIADSENVWARLRSQINSALQLGIEFSKITKYIRLPYDYRQREVLKYAIWTDTSEEVLKSLGTEMTYREMIANIEMSKIDKGLTEMVDKPLDAMSQMLTAITETVNTLRSDADSKAAETEKALREKEEKIAELEGQIKEKADDLERVLSQTDENNRINMMEQKMHDMEVEHSRELQRIADEKEQQKQKDEISKMKEDALDEIARTKADMEKDMMEKADAEAKKKFEEYRRNWEDNQNRIEQARREEQKKLEQERKKHEDEQKNFNYEMEKLKRQLYQQQANMVNSGEVKKRGFWKKKTRVMGAVEEKTEEGSAVFGNIDILDCSVELPSDFDITSYMMKAELSSDVYEIICVAAKCGCPDIILKNMADSKLPADRLKPVLETYLAKRAREDKNFQQNVNDGTSEEDIVYVDEQ